MKKAEINKSNYEIFIIDYMDGKLSADEAAELFEFMDKHDDVKKEFALLRGMDKINATPESIDKSTLKKTENIDVNAD